MSAHQADWLARLFKSHMLKTNCEIIVVDDKVVEAANEDPRIVLVIDQPGFFTVRLETPENARRLTKLARQNLLAIDAVTGVITELPAPPTEEIHV
jgi:KaiC/GvpD/RAD55 family RecA-like ATPase